MKTIYIQPMVAALFSVLGIVFGLKAKKQTRSGHTTAGRIRFKLAMAFLFIGIGLWIWYLGVV